MIVLRGVYLWVLVRRPRVAIEGIAWSLVFWGVWFGIALIHDGTRWPRELPPSPSRNLPGRSLFEAWEAFAVTIVMIEASWLAAHGIYRRTPQRDPLVWSLLAFFGAFALLFLYALTADLYSWSLSFWERQAVVFGPLLITMSWFIWQLSRLPDGGGSRSVMPYDPHVHGERRSGRERRES